MLTPKQRRFVDAYLTSSNGTQAAIQAGYSKKTARSIASENLRKPEIVAEIDARMDRRLKQSGQRDALVLEALAKIGFSSPAGMFDARGVIKHPKDWPREALDGIRSIKFDEKTIAAPSGKKKRVAVRTTVKMHDKVKALIALGDHLGMWGPQKRSK